MEKLLTTEERIRRAEEIYASRRNMQTRNSTATVNVREKRNFKLFRKLVIQILVCVLIYYIFFITNSSNNVFSEDAINKVRKVLSYDINFENLYNTTKGFVMNFVPNQSIENPEGDKVQGENPEDNVQENGLEEATLSISEDREEDGDVEQLSQMEQDVNEIKNNYELQKPVEGQISSLFGPRESTSSIVSNDHSGIDIAAEEGTKIKAAMDGTISISQESPSYGKYIKIENGEISMIYAHCKEVYVQKGESVSAGQEIAEVGSTGYATGPHLHLEVARQERLIDPIHIFEF